MFKRILCLLAFVFVYFSIDAYGAQDVIAKAIYGEDDRQEVYSYQGTIWAEYARSTAAMVDKKNLRKCWFSRKYRIRKVDSLQEEINLCSYERFSSQRRLAFCTGFLVDNNKLLTAGHCITNKDDCKRFRWLFDYQADSHNQKAPKKYKKNKVYRCKKIIKRELAGEDLDYALIELDRVVTDRDPLPLRQTGEVAVGTTLVVIGNPSGIPTKISENAKVLSNDGEFAFNTDLDTFEGNSGSPVINRETGEVEGILVSGSQDYEFDVVNACQAYHVCTDSSCNGENVSRIANVFPW